MLESPEVFSFCQESHSHVTPFITSTSWLGNKPRRSNQIIQLPTPVIAHKNCHNLTKMATRSFTKACSQLATSQPSCAARTFIQLAPRRFHHSTPPPLDFLLPSLSQTSHVHPNTRSISGPRHGQAKRSFTTSARRQTSAIYNPQKDEDGNLMEIDITPRASNVCSHNMWRLPEYIC